MNEVVKEKVFEHFLVFPEEVRMVVINEMEPNDRCRFTECSKLSQKDAQKCKKYIYGMRFSAISPNNINFSVTYHEKYKNNERGDYNVNFFYGYGKKYIVYSNRLGVELWRSELDSSINLMEYAFENVKYMLNLYQRTIKKLLIWIWTTENYDLEIRSLSNLESLTLCDITDIRQIMSKIRKPLKEFVYSPPMLRFSIRELQSPRSISEVNIQDIEQIYEVQNLLNLYRTRLNYEQFRKLSAQQIHINIGILTEEDISSFIKSWQNGKLRKNFISCRWNINESRFDVQRLLRLLGIRRNFEERRGGRRTNINIKHNKDAAKKAKLSFGFREFNFHVLIQ